MLSFRITHVGLLVLEKKIFAGFLLYMGVAVIFRSPYPYRLHKKFGFDWLSGFEEEDVLVLWTTDGRTTDGRKSMSIL